MDLKGITWVGHVYQKFEAMCLEVEEAIYQDTVKYVENQAHTVGSSVKKFYSDVMEDFLPPSSMDLVKGKVVSNLPAEQNTDVIGICKKPKASIKEEARKVDNEQLSVDSPATADLDKGASHGQSFHGFHVEDISFQASSGNTIKGAACSDVCPKVYDVTADLSGFHLEDTSFQASSGDTIKGAACSDIKGAACSDVHSNEYDVTADLDKSASHGRPFHGFHIEDTSFQASSRPRDTFKGAACSDDVSKEYDLRCGHNQSSFCMQKISKEENMPPSEMSGEIPHMERLLRGRGSSSCELMDKNQEAYDDQVAANLTSVIPQVASLNSIGEINDELDSASKGAFGGCVSPVGSFVNEDVQPNEFPDKITFVCHPGLSDYSAINKLESSVVDQGFETIRHVDNKQIEEACVLVNGDELCFVTRKESKPRPYKKKIQDAISSRMRSARKHEYKQLAVCYEEDVRSKQETAETKGSPSHGSCELEWELL